MTPAAVSPDPFPYLRDDDSEASLLDGIQESARVTLEWWKRMDVKDLTDVEGGCRVVVDAATDLVTVMPDFDTYLKLWGHVCSPFQFNWKDYHVTRFGSFMYLEYVIDVLEEQRDLYKGDAVTKGTMVFIFFNDFVDKLKRFYWKEAESMGEISGLLGDLID